MIKVQKHKSASLVVSSYKENIDWTDNVKQNLFLYNKNEIDVGRSNLIKLKNVGRESHTYLHHIVEHYNDLDDVVIFCQGNPFDHCPYFLETLECQDLIAMNELCKKLDQRNWPITNSNFCAIGHHWIYDIENQVMKDWEYQCKIPFCAIAMEVMFPRHKPIFKLNSIWGAIFAVSKECIHQHKLQKYKKLLDYHYEFWSIPWAMESIWAHIFYDPDKPQKMFS